MWPWIKNRKRQRLWLSEGAELWGAVASVARHRFGFRGTSPLWLRADKTRVLEMNRVQTKFARTLEVHFAVVDE